MKNKSFKYAVLALRYQPFQGEVVTDHTLVSLPAHITQAGLDDFLAGLPSRDVLAIEYGVPNLSPVSHPEETNNAHHPWITIAGLAGTKPPKKAVLKEQPPLDFEPIMSALLEQTPVDSYHPIRLAYLHQRALLGLEQAADALGDGGVPEFNVIKERVDSVIKQALALKHSG